MDEPSQLQRPKPAKGWIESFGGHAGGASYLNPEYPLLQCRFFRFARWVSGAMRAATWRGARPPLAPAICGVLWGQGCGRAPPCLVRDWLSSLDKGAGERGEWE